MSHARFAALIPVTMSWFSAYALSATPSMDEIRKEHRDSGAELKTYALVDAVHRHVNWGAAHATRKARLEDMRSQAITAMYAESTGVSQEIRNRREDEINEHFDRIEQGIDRIRSNPDLVFLRKRTVDLGNGRVRWDDSDQQDLIPTPEQEAQWAVADRSVVRILRDKTHYTISSFPEKTARALSGGYQDLDHERLRVGLLPAWLFEPDVKIELKADRKAELLTIRGTTPQGTFSGTLKAEAPYLLSHFEVRALHEDTIQEWRLSGVVRASRNLNLPASCEFRIRLRGVADYVVEKSIAQSLQAGVSVPEQLFEVPPDHRLIEE